MPSPDVESAQDTTKEVNGRLSTLDHRAVEDLQFALRGVDTYGFDYIDVETFAKVEKGIIALAALNGATGPLNLETAITFLSKAEDQWKEERSELERSISTLESDARDTEAELDVAEKKLQAYEEAPEPSVIGAIYVEQEQRDEIADVLDTASDLLARVPGQQALAERALRVLELVKGLESRDVIEVEDTDEEI